MSTSIAFKIGYPTFSHASKKWRTNAAAFAMAQPKLAANGSLNSPIAGAFAEAKMQLPGDFHTRPTSSA
jgi:hypothetical protein